MTPHAQDHDDGHATDDAAEPDHDHRVLASPSGSLPRRRVLGWAAALAAAGVAGCGGQSTPAGTPTPVALDGGEQCDVCGMVIAEHPGPSATTSFAERGPEGHEGPAWFDSVKERFVYVQRKRERGWEPTATYVTDYSAVNYEVTETADGFAISRHVGPASFVAASEVVYVAGSDVHGAMGVELLPFSARDDAAAFREKYGGWLVAHGEVDEETLQRLRDGDDG